jgi:hypothetical protein
VEAVILETSIIKRGATFASSCATPAISTLFTSAMLLRLLVSFLAPAAALVVPVHERNDDVVLGNWIVQLKCGIDPSTIQAHHVTARAIHQRNSKRHDGGIKKTFKVRDFNAYSGTFDEATAAEIASLPEVRVLYQMLKERGN